MIVQRFLIVVEKAGRGYSAYSPDLPGCISTGKSREEVETNMHEAIAFHLEGLIEDGIAIPRPQSSAAYLLQELPEPPKRTNVKRQKAARVIR
jgi:predicted RNase H-like HicB family nuclease